MKIAISAVEISGDLLAAQLIKTLKTQSADIQIQGLAGEKMRQAGCTQIWAQSQIEVMGFSEILKKLPALLRLQKAIIRYFSQHTPAVFIGVDGPDFNFLIEKKLKQKGIKTVHFISPSLWAWREKRIKKIKKSTDLILCVFPFEVDFYQKNHQPAVFVGHPLTLMLRPRPHKPKGKRILLMPGSREDEIKHLLPEMLKSVINMGSVDDGLDFHLVLANTRFLGWVKKQIKIKTPKLTLSIADSHAQIALSDVVILASGSASLEAAIIGVPMVVVYKLSAISYFFAKRLVKIPHVALPNILSGKKIVPELIQNQANADNITQNALSLLRGENTQMMVEFANIYQQLCADENLAAQHILALINE